MADSETAQRTAVVAEARSWVVNQHWIGTPDRRPIGPHEPPCPCEMDHLIPLSLGGSNRQKNLWPQSEITEPWNAHVKDKLEGTST
jgi:hypothetical protein